MIDDNYLACSHHSLMIASTGLYAEQENVKALLIGLGGGALASYMTNKFKNVTDIQVVS